MKVVTGGTLIDGTGHDPVPNASVVIDDEGRITHAGKLESKPQGAEVIDVSGKTIMPGLIDSHVHLFVELEPMQDSALTPLSLRVLKAAQNARATLDAGITSVLASLKALGQNADTSPSRYWRQVSQSQRGGEQCVRYDLC